MSLGLRFYVRNNSYVDQVWLYSVKQMAWMLGNNDHNNGGNACHHILGPLELFLRDGK